MASANDSPAVEWAVKRVKFMDRENVPVLCQNANGPCPLLAIANILALRNQLQLPASCNSVSLDRLINVIAQKVLDSGSADADKAQALGNAGYEANLRQNIADCLPVLGKLNAGLDVNLRFDRPGAFEATRELTVFDLLGIDIVHGWVVDPEDPEVVRIIGQRSFNELQVALAEADSAAAAAHAAASPPQPPPTPTPTPPAAPPLPQSPPPAGAGDLIDLLDMDLSEQPTEAAAVTPAPTAAGPAPPDPLDLLWQPEPAEQPLPTAAPADDSAPAPSPVAPASPPPTSPPASPIRPLPSPAADARSPSTPPAAPPPLPPQLEQQLHEARVIRRFLDATCSQLTWNGLFELCKQMRPNQLAVFFRNDHFNVVFKHEDQLFLLVTDEGYRTWPNVVWERLDRVDNDTQMCGAGFQPYVPSENTMQAGPAAVYEELSAADAEAIAAAATEGLDVDAGHARAAAAAGRPTDRDHVAAAALGADAPSRLAGRAAVLAPVVGPGHVDTAADADLALAMQLQEEEYEAEQAELLRQQQQQQQQQQAQQQQQVRSPPQQYQQPYQAPGRPVQAGVQRAAPVQATRASQQMYAQARQAQLSQQQQQQQYAQEQLARQRQQAARGPPPPPPAPPAEESKCTIC